MNCLETNHFVRECKSNHKCKQCQRPHHTLSHEDSPNDTPSAPPDDSPSSPVTSHTVMNAGLKSSSILMTHRILVISPNGSSSEARAILDSASSASIISDHLARTLNLPHLSQNTHITGIAGLSHKSPTQSITNFVVFPSRLHQSRINYPSFRALQSSSSVSTPSSCEGSIRMISKWMNDINLNGRTISKWMNDMNLNG